MPNASPVTARVDFYVLENGDIAARDVLACRLAEKGFQQGLRVYVRTANRVTTAELNELMWRFSSPAFVPHVTIDEYQDCAVLPDAVEPAPVLIGETAAPDDYHDMLVSLVDDVPDDAARFRRIADLISSDQHQKQLGRVRYRAYRDSGAAPEIHNI